MEDETESVQTRFKSHSVLYQGSRASYTPTGRSEGGEVKRRDVQCPGRQSSRKCGERKKNANREA